MRLSIAFAASFLPGVFSLSPRFASIPARNNLITAPASSPSSASPTAQSCYTYTTSIYPSQACPTASGCIDLFCITTVTSTMPCPTASCPMTATVTATEPCRTACLQGCTTSVTSVMASGCSKYVMG
ncbi:hypothetical protein VTN00DRAFT_3872 [Thermoascus crustaceus]|uniref:uncharacterized protein n=1 Tax=Thermoascus crustaceus TaxID=5088 RepID=UPI003744AF0B